MTSILLEGFEPIELNDECYCIGTEKEFPDIALEVIVTSGGVDNLEVYKRLGIKEVWFWQSDRTKYTNT
jgi:Uma2 family endonuclease